MTDVDETISRIDQVLDDQEITDLVDWQMSRYGERSGYDFNVHQPRCGHCGADEHHLAVTERMQRMRRWGAVPDGYRYDEDDSPVVCPGSRAPGPVGFKQGLVDAAREHAMQLIARPARDSFRPMPVAPNPFLGEGGPRQQPQRQFLHTDSGMILETTSQPSPPVRLREILRGIRRTMTAAMGADFAEAMFGPDPDGDPSHDGHVHTPPHGAQVDMVVVDEVTPRTVYQPDPWQPGDPSPGLTLNRRPVGGTYTVHGGGALDGTYRYDETPGRGGSGGRGPERPFVGGRRGEPSGLLAPGEVMVRPFEVDDEPWRVIGHRAGWPSPAWTFPMFDPSSWMVTPPPDPFAQTQVRDLKVRLITRDGRPIRARHIEVTAIEATDDGFRLELTPNRQTLAAIGKLPHRVMVEGCGGARERMTGEINLIEYDGDGGPVKVRVTSQRRALPVVFNPEEDANA